ncbi:MAG: enoyl-CoA hydratase, partial [Spirochaetia bacterium]|nr:enoyl-CoA hydratase [Spirochaetia bacterium]
SAAEALRMGLVSQVFPSHEELMKGALKLAEEIARNDGLVLRGVKNLLNYMESHDAADGLRYVAAWNAAFIDGDRFREMLGKLKERMKR